MRTSETLLIDSAAVAVDGDAKCGKTTVIEMIAEEAKFQRSVIPNLTMPHQLEADFELDEPASELLRIQLSTLQEDYAFQYIEMVSVGSVYRAAALLRALREFTTGDPVTQFAPEDADELRELLAKPGVDDVLQNDPNVVNLVAPTGQLLGAHALCGAIFSEQVVEAYERDGGGNLVIMDARDPVGHLARNGKLGLASGQVRPGSIIPIYIDTPAEVAASRMAGDYEANLAKIELRRHQDAIRTELPVVRPARMVEAASDWHELTSGTSIYDRTEVLPPLLIDNGRETTLGQIQHLSGTLAMLAHNLAVYTHAERQQLTA